MENGNVPKRQQPVKDEVTAQGHQWVFNGNH